MCQNMKPFPYWGDIVSWTEETNIWTYNNILATTDSSDDEELEKPFYPNTSQVHTHGENQTKEMEVLTLMNHNITFLLYELISSTILL